MDYAFLKTVHLTTVALSLGGFVLRGLGVLGGKAWARGRIARILPHINDTALLISAIALAWMLRLNPLEQPWLTAKIVALLIYVALGTIALKSASPPRATIALVAAIATFFYIVAVASSKSVIP